MPDDPLYVPGGTTNFMVLTRATLAGPGAHGVMGTSDDTDRPVNTTTSFVDQNQTYTSHPSHQVFLREYVNNAAGDPVATGKLIEGGNSGIDRSAWQFANPLSPRMAAALPGSNHPHGGAQFRFALPASTQSTERD